MARQSTLDQAARPSRRATGAGGVGVSAGTVDEDDQIARAGATADSGVESAAAPVSPPGVRLPGRRPG
jgi:hypothetical protein